MIVTAARGIRYDPRRVSAPARTILFLGADTSMAEPLDLAGEVRDIEAKLASAGQDHGFALTTHLATTPDALQEVLLRTQPTVVHVSGHGQGAEGGRQGIMLHGSGHEAVTVVGGPALAHLFSVVRGDVRVVVLNACHSRAQAEPLAEVVDFVVGIDGAIRDEAARVFAAAFYRALGFGRTVQTAFELGVNALMLEGLDHDVHLPVLLHREGVDPTQVVLVEAATVPEGEWWDVFVSYAHADRGPAHMLATNLHELELRVFLDEWELGAGDVLSRRLEAGLRGSKNGLIVVSAASVSRPWVQEEYAVLLQQAVEKGKRLIPVVIGETELPPFLGTRMWVDLRGKTGDDYRVQLELVAKALRGQRPGPPVRTGVIRTP
jgi:hypothetical protein